MPQVKKCNCCKKAPMGAMKNKNYLLACDCKTAESVTISGVVQIWNENN